MRHILFILALCLYPIFASAQLYACRDSIKNGYDFWLYVPEDYRADTAEKPLVMFLHGKSLSGHNLAKVREYGCINALEKGRDIDAIVVAPQTSSGWNPKKVLELYDWVKERYAIDTNRLYVLGMSMGGYGTLDFAATYPEKVAAAIALCGGSTKNELCGLNEVPLWIIHGTADKHVPVRCSERVVDSMCACGDTCLLLFDKLDKVNHSRLARVFYMEQTYDWLFSHSLSDTLRKVNREFQMNKEVLDNAYKGLKTNKIKIKDSKPSSPDTSSDDGDAEVYIVKKGDTLGRIAARYHTTVNKLCELNHISKTSTLQIGQRIRVK